MSEMKANAAAGELTAPDEADERGFWLFDKENHPPVCVIYPAFGMSAVRDPVLSAMTHDLSGLGYAVLAVDNAPKKNGAPSPDFMAMLDHAEKAMRQIEGRRHVFMPVSCGINVAFRVMNANTRGIFAVMPGPDLIQEIIAPKIIGPIKHEEKHVQGRHLIKAGKLRVLLSKDSYKIATEDTADNPGRLFELIKLVAVKPPVWSLASETDETVPFELTQAWNQSLLESGFASRIIAIAGLRHEITSETINVALRVAQPFLREELPLERTIGF